MITFFSLSRDKRRPAASAEKRPPKQAVQPSREPTQVTKDQCDTGMLFVVNHIA